jgi:hypothetical protein
MKKRLGGAELISEVMAGQEVRGGSLNPTWVEWLMGYPTGWTNLNALAMQWFQNKRKKRSKD